MQIEAEVSRDGILTAKVPARYRGKHVLIRVEDRDNQASQQWQALSAILDEINEAADIPRRSHREILDAVHDFRES